VSGALPSFAPVPIVTLPYASLLTSGPYWWIAAVDNDSIGVVDGDLVDVALPVVP